MAAGAASFSETLASKYGGIPVWGWFAVGVGALALLMFLRSKSSANAASAQAAAQNTQPQPLQTNLLSPEVAASLAQGAAPMAYMGGDIYNNILNQPSSTANATATATGNNTTVNTPPPTPGTPAPSPAPAPASPAPASRYGAFVIPQGSGESYSYVASHAQGIAPNTTWQQLYALNTNPNGPHSAAAAAKLASQGQNLLYGGQTVYYPLS